MRKWNLPLTYVPKIAPVIVGTIRQTIRTVKEGKTPKEVGDLIRFYMWTGLPYHSQRETITSYYPLTEAWHIVILPYGINFYNFEGYLDHTEEWEELDWLAIRDGIPTGLELKAVLSGLNKIPANGIEAQILRW